MDEKKTEQIHVNFDVEGKKIINWETSLIDNLMLLGDMQIDLVKVSHRL